MRRSPGGGRGARGRAPAPPPPGNPPARRGGGAGRAGGGGAPPGRGRGPALLGEVAGLDEGRVEAGDGERVLEAAQPRGADVGVGRAGGGGDPAPPGGDEVLGRGAGAAALVRAPAPGRLGVEGPPAVDDG